MEQLVVPYMQPEKEERVIDWVMMMMIFPNRNNRLLFEFICTGEYFQVIRLLIKHWEKSYKNKNCLDEKVKVIKLNTTFEAFQLLHSWLNLATGLHQGDIVTLDISTPKNRLLLPSSNLLVEIELLPPHGLGQIFREWFAWFWRVETLAMMLLG